MSVATAARSGLRAVARSVPPRAAPAALDLAAVQAKEAAREREAAEAAKAAKAEEPFSFGNPNWKQPLNKSFALHLGAELRLPCGPEKPAAPAATTREAQAQAAGNPFEGLPLLGLAERLGERVAPVYHDFRRMEAQAQREAKAAAAAAQPVEMPVPHFLPFTRMAVKHPEFKKTFVFDEKDRKVARLSWYHPDDTMVPRDWLQGGLLADLKYYFGK